MTSPFPAVRLAADKAKVRFVDQVGGRERLTRFLLRQFPRGQAAQFLVDQRQQMSGGLFVAALDGVQNLSDLVHGR